VNLGPLLNAPIAIQLHVLTVVPAFFLGAWLLLVSRKGLDAFMSFSLGAGPVRLRLIHLFIPLTDCIGAA
jgi:uncharacterized membrane protein